MSRLRDLGFRGEEHRDVGMFVGRVAADYGIQFEVWAEQGVQRAIVPGKNRSDLSPAVGDFVVVMPSDDGVWVIREILERRTELVRQAAGKRTKAQVIGANLDTVFVVSSMNQEFNARRIERYITAVQRSGASAVIVLNKSDLADDADAYLNEAKAAAPGVEVIGMSALDAENVRAHLATWLRPEQTVAFVGSSGVGKSTIINNLLGTPEQRVSEIRLDDDEGRHTTTHRQLFELPGAGMLLDTPGMRELQLWGDEDDIEDAFPDLEELALHCRFADCEHAAEPGCAVQGAVVDGTLDVARVDAWRKLKQELAFQARKTDAAAQLADKRRTKSVQVANRQTLKHHRKYKND